MADVVRRVVVTATDSGVEAVTAKLTHLAAANDKVAVASDRSAKVQESAARRLNNIQRTYDAAYRQKQELAKVERVLEQSVRDGLITAERQAEVMGLATTRLGMATSAVHSNSAALQINAQASRMAAMQQRNLVFQLNDVFVSLASGMNPLMVAAQQGSQIATIYGPDEGGIGRAFRETGKMALSAAAGIGRFAAAHPAAIAATVGLGLGLRSVMGDLQAAGHAGIGYGDIMVAAMQVAASGVYSVLEPAITTISTTVSNVLDTAAGYFALFANKVIGLGVGTVAAFRAAWDDLPGFLYDIGARAGWALSDRIIFYVNEAIGFVQEQIKWANDTLKTSIPMPHMIQRFRPPSPTSGATGGAVDAFNEAMGRNYIEELGNAIKAKAIANSLKEVEGAAKGAGGALKGAKEQAEELNKTATEAADGIFKGLGTDIVGGFKKMFEDGKVSASEFGDYIANIFLNIGNRLIENALKPMENALNSFFDSFANQQGGGGWGGILGGLFSGLFPAAPLGGGGDWLTGLYANGGAFNSGGVIPFARGGAFTNSIVDKPTLFPFAKGTGLMGEAGPEAIMPLKRASNGSLGVQVAGGGSSAPVSVNYAPTITITGGDAGSETRLKAMLEQHKRDMPGIAVKAVRDARKRGGAV